MSEKKDTIVSADKAREILEKATNDRLIKCKNELDIILQKYACTIEVAITVTGSGKIIPNIQLLPQDK